MNAYIDMYIISLIPSITQNLNIEREHMGGEEIIEYENTLTPSRRGEHALGSSTESMRSTYLTMQWGIGRATSEGRGTRAHGQMYLLRQLSTTAGLRSQ